MAIEGHAHNDKERDRRLRFLVAAGTLLAENITDYEATLKTIARLAITSRIADVCLFDVLDEHGGPRLAAVSAVRSVIEDRLLQAGRFLRSDSGRPPHPVLRVIMDRTSHLVPNIDEAYIERFASSAGHAAFMREIGYRSKMIVPVVAGKEVLGTLTLVRTGRDAEPFDAADLLLAEDLGRRAGVAYENARAYARQLRVATLLQEASLPGALATLPHGRFDAHYRPGSREALIGGDWYDAFPLDDGRVGITIGDVLGSGVSAAVTMGRLRQAMQSAAYVEPDPNVMIYAADRVLSHNDPDVYATALAAIYDPSRRTLRLASGGHPGPIERRVDGTLVDHSLPGIMLGLRAERRTEFKDVTLGIGSTVAFFSDGLIEQTKNIEEGYERLHAALTALDPNSPHPARDIVDA